MLWHGGPLALIVGSTAREAILESRTSQTTQHAMANLSGYLLIDASTGTVLSASTCYLVADDAFTVEDWDSMESFSDAEMCDFAKHRGEKLSDVVRLRPILPGES